MNNVIDIDEFYSEVYFKNGEGAFNSPLCRHEMMLDGLLDLLDFLKENNVNNTALELGCHSGESACIFARHFKSIICIDNWCWGGYPVERIFDFRSSFFPNIKKIKENLYSTDIINKLNIPENSIEFLYIDADHSYDAVKHDIKTFIPLVKDNFYIGGHDYHCVEVKRAVDECMNSAKIKRFRDTSWLFKKEDFKK